MGRLVAFVARALAVAVVVVACTQASRAAGALAVGRCAAYGYAYDFKETTQARVEAMRKCAGDCKVVAVLHRTCAAFAIDGRNACGPHGYATAPTLGRAQNVALRHCYKYGGRDCVVRAFACDAGG